MVDAVLAQVEVLGRREVAGGDVSNCSCHGLNEEMNAFRYYTYFLLKAANNDGKWSGEVEALHIRVLPVWYRTWWAFLIFALFFILLVFAVFRFFWLRKSMQTEIRMERLDREKKEEVRTALSM